MIALALYCWGVVLAVAATGCLLALLLTAIDWVRYRVGRHGRASYDHEKETPPPGWEEHG